MVSKTFCDVCSTEIEGVGAELIIAENLLTTTIDDSRDLCDDCANLIRDAANNEKSGYNSLREKLGL